MKEVRNPHARKDLLVEFWKTEQAKEPSGRFFAVPSKGKPLEERKWDFKKGRTV